jgi:hypothetical protein
MLQCTGSNVQTECPYLASPICLLFVPAFVALCWPCLRAYLIRARRRAGSSALYLFLYSAFYFYTKLDITKTVPMLMYFGYMLVISFGFFCVTGTIGFYACYLFVRTIYAAVKID